jgi:hypothetical protein
MAGWTGCKEAKFVAPKIYTYKNQLYFDRMWREGGTGSVQYDHSNSENWTVPDNNWHRMVVYHYPDWTSNGRWKVWVDDQLIHDDPGPNISDYTKVCTNIGGNALRVGTYHGRDAMRGKEWAMHFDNFRIVNGGPFQDGVTDPGYKLADPGGVATTFVAGPGGVGGNAAPEAPSDMKADVVGR